MFLTLFCLLASRLVQPLSSSPCMCGKAMVEEATLPNNLTMDKILRHLTVMREADRLESDTSSGIVSIGDEDLTTDIIAAAALGEATFQDDVIPAHVKDDVDLNHIQDDVDLAPVADGDSKLPESSPLVVAPIHLRTVIDPEIGETALEPIVSESATDMPSERIPVGKSRVQIHARCFCLPVETKGDGTQGCRCSSEEMSKRAGSAPSFKQTGKNTSPHCW